MKQNKFFPRNVPRGTFCLLAILTIVVAATTSCGSDDPKLTINLKYPTVITMPSNRSAIDGKTNTFIKSFSQGADAQGNPRTTNHNYRIKDLVFSMGGKEIPLVEPKAIAGNLIIEDVDAAIEFKIKGMVTTNAGGTTGYKSFEAKASLTSAGKVADIEYPAPPNMKFLSEFSISTEGGQISSLMLQDDDEEIEFDVVVGGQIESTGAIGITLSLTEVGD